MSVSYKKLQHILIERNISHSQLMRKANISANIISKIKTGQYIALDKVECICNALECTPNDILVFIPDNEIDNNSHKEGDN
ncbi:MAG: XRE family transcriptional regulator [Clostridiales bacterium]|nr:XRE family transcriptional regulator [Clostridiales bacterium]